MTGFTNTTNITIDNINNIINATNPVDISVRANWFIYDGYMYFILFLMASIFIYIKLQTREDQPLTNAMISSTIMSIAVIFYRGVQIYVDGTLYPLLTDHQMWIFPVITVGLVLINYMTKKS